MRGGIRCGPPPTTWELRAAHLQRIGRDCVSLHGRGGGLRQGCRGRWCGALPGLLLLLLPVVPVEVAGELHAQQGSLPRAKEWQGESLARGGALTSGSMSSARGADDVTGEEYRLLAGGADDATGAGSALGYVAVAAA